MAFSKPWVLCAVSVLSCVVAAGCESNNDDEGVRDKDLERIARRDRQRQRERDRDLDPIVARDRDRDRDRDAPRDRSLDRAGDRRPGLREIPADAMAVETGEGERLEHTAARDGVVYVYDVDDDRVVYVGRIREREQFRLDPGGGRGLINSRVVFRSDLNPRHRYRLYFDPAG